MAYEKKDFIWTPTEATGYNFTSILATMASSIETSVGKYIYFAEGTASPQNTSNFEPYSPGNVIRAVRNGRYVSVFGTWKCKTANYLVGATARNFAQLPVGFRPKDRIATVQQGSGTVHWYLEANTDGTLNAARATSNHSNNFWMPFHITYLAED